MVKLIPAPLTDHISGESKAMTKPSSHPQPLSQPREPANNRSAAEIPNEDPAGSEEKPMGENQSQKSEPEANLDTHATVPIMASNDNFRTLPEGALLGDEAYYVVSIRSEGPDCNIYGVEETQPVLPCPNLECGYLENPISKQDCISCGTPLNDTLPIHRRHLLREYRHFSDVEMAAHMVELDLSHPGLLPYRYFEERPYGNHDRYYLVLPDPMPMLASKAPLPQKAARVLTWGAQLADALAYLHTHNIALQHIDADHIALRERRAMWIDLNTARALSSDQADAAQRQRQDVADLATVMFYLATGENTYDSKANLPQTAVDVFARVLDSRAEITTAQALAKAFRESVAAIRRPTTLRLRVGQHTDVGMVRDLNEDSLLVIRLDRVHRSISQPLGLYAIADGMGGHAAGDVASGMVINTLAEKMAANFLVPQLRGDIDIKLFDAQHWLEETVQAANTAVYSHRQSAGTNMGTTLVAALLIGNTAHIANVGDSRAYLVTQDDGIHQITTDHSLVERLISTGQILPEEARTHPQRNVIYRTIGDKEKAEIDFFVQRLDPGDSLLLCSDGLNGKVEDNEIWRLVSRSLSPQEACEQLIQAANENGGNDNVTAIILQASS
jgi:serine/threonine protein phosphatase PrpC